MKKIIFLFTFLFIAVNLNSQPYFQKITSGSLVTTPTKGNIAAWGDYNNDGYQDVVISCVNDACENCTYSLNLYKNNGDGSFTRIENNGIGQVSVVGSGLAWADYDNDGFLDLFVCGTNNSKNKLLHNNQNGGFELVTTGIVVNDILSSSQGCAWADYNKDGWIDLFVANRNYEKNFLYKNNGNGDFTKVTTGNIANDIGKSRSCSWGDYDNDGWIDLFVLNYEGQNDYLYLNNGNETFTKVTDVPMVNDSKWGNSCGWIDFDNNDRMDLLVTNNSSTNSIFINEGNGDFTTGSSVITMEGNSHGFTFGDYDNDGYEDIFICNKSRNNTLFKNNSGASFTKITNEVVGAEGGNASISASMIDYDNDGKLDLFVTNRFSNQYNYLYKNYAANYNYITVKLHGCLSNNYGIGARVKVYTNGKKQIKDVSSGTGWGSQCALWPHFGLGTAVRIDSLVVYWPSDSVSRFYDLPVNSIVSIQECGSGVIGIQEISNHASKYELQQNFPNPFNPKTIIRYSLTQSNFTTLKVYDILGNEVAVLVNEMQNAGSYSVDFDGSSLSSGIYYYRLESENFVSTQKMSLLK